MIIYAEKSLESNLQAKKILEKHSNSDIIWIDNHKNIFDKNIALTREKSIILAKGKNFIQNAPDGYGFAGTNAFFLKNSINCVFDCDYCYLKGAFKNYDLLFFLDYETMKNEVIETIKKEDNGQVNRFYSSDYSDNLATDNLTDFTSEFIPFFETLENTKLEIRTKSNNIGNLLKITAPKNTEIAFSLNPSEVVEAYEHKTTSLDERIKSINTLLDAGWNVGIRFLPLVEIENYKEIYDNFLNYLKGKIDFSRISSVFIGGLLYTNDDYNNILKAKPLLDLLYKLHKDGDFYRENRGVRDRFYTKFGEFIKEKKCNICLDN
ncbi:MAG: hypothetical protein PHG82_02845 [Candidatus Gracilibacteria bacterium]|nr:hypothetical protein [Candidatus Gracilibacteria bacterium]